jgi:hypothetical protein
MHILPVGNSSLRLIGSNRPRPLYGSPPAPTYSGRWQTDAVNQTGEHGSQRVRWLVVPAAGAYAWWATTLRPFTHPALVVTLLTGALVVLLAARNRKDAVPPASGVAWWLVLFAAAGAWELAAFVQIARR